MSTPPAASGPDTLSGPLLAALRREAGLRQTEVAAALSDVSQAQLSRVEQWRAIPSPEMTRALLELYAARTTSLSRDRIEALVTQAEALGVEHVDARVVLQAGRARNFQLRIREAEQGAKVVRSYHPTTILGVLQTRAFASEWFTPGDQLSGPISAADAAASINERMLRWAALSEPGRRWHLLQTEQALRWPVRHYGVQADQLDQMVVASHLPNVTLQVISLDTLAPNPAPLTGFHLYDDRQLAVGTDLGTALVSSASRVQAYLSRFEVLAGLALSPDDSRDLLSRLSRDYRARG